jgi:hypothetical protein
LSDSLHDAVKVWMAEHDAKHEALALRVTDLEGRVGGIEGREVARDAKLDLILNQSTESVAYLRKFDRALDMRLFPDPDPDPRPR